MTWDNGDRTVLVNPNLRGATLGWNLQSTAQDELFAAIEGTALHTRVILDRMQESGVPITRMINAGGIPQKNPVLNQVYANVLGRPVLVPSKSVVSLGSAIFAFLAAGTFRTVEEAQDRLCPPHTISKPMTSEKGGLREAVSFVPQAIFCVRRSIERRSRRGHAGIDMRCIIRWRGEQLKLNVPATTYSNSMRHCADLPQQVKERESK